MAFSIKQLLFWMAVLAFGLVAMFSKDMPVLGRLFDLLTLGILIGAAYGAWLSTGQARAFCIGFLCWAALYFYLFKRTFEINRAISEMISLAYRSIGTQIVVPRTGGGGLGFRPQYPNFIAVFHSLLLLLVGILGGWVTVYFYRKRQRMLAQET
jgi:hypothetical protein